GKGKPLYIIPLYPKEATNNSLGYLTYDTLRYNYQYAIQPGNGRIFFKFLGTQPGQYTFSADLLISIEGVTCTLPLLSSQTWIFKDL
ncbi:MAG: hypothetical protein AAFU60_10160, partial [Bacteroidota bacterium]